MTKKIFEKSLTLIGQDPDAFSTYFYHTVIDNSEELKNIFRNSDLKVQKVELVKGFLMIFSFLESSVGLKVFLQNLGVRHVCYEVKTHHYETIKACLLETLKHIHRTDWNDELESSWPEFIDFICEHMLTGASTVKAK